MYDVRRTLYVYNVNYSKYITLRRTLYDVHYTAYGILRHLFSVRRTMYGVYEIQNTYFAPQPLIFNTTPSTANPRMVWGWG